MSFLQNCLKNYFATEEFKSPDLDRFVKNGEGTLVVKKSGDYSQDITIEYASGFLGRTWLWFKSVGYAVSNIFNDNHKYYFGSDAKDMLILNFAARIRDMNSEVKANQKNMVKELRSQPDHSSKLQTIWDRFHSWTPYLSSTTLNEEDYPSEGIASVFQELKNFEKVLLSHNQAISTDQANVLKFFSLVKADQQLVSSRSGKLVKKQTTSDAARREVESNLLQFTKSVVKYKQSLDKIQGVKEYLTQYELDRLSDHNRRFEEINFEQVLEESFDSAFEGLPNYQPFDQIIDSLKENFPEMALRLNLKFLKKHFGGSINPYFQNIGIDYSKEEQLASFLTRVVDIEKSLDTAPKGLKAEYELLQPYALIEYEANLLTKRWAEFTERYDKKLISRLFISSPQKHLSINIVNEFKKRAKALDTFVDTLKSLDKPEFKTIVDELENQLKPYIEEALPKAICQQMDFLRQENERTLIELEMNKGSLERALSRAEQKEIKHTQALASLASIEQLATPLGEQESVLSELIESHPKAFELLRALSLYHTEGARLSIQDFVQLHPEFKSVLFSRVEKTLRDQPFTLDLLDGEVMDFFPNSIYSATRSNISLERKIKLTIQELQQKKRSYTDQIDRDKTQLIAKGIPYPADFSAFNLESYFRLVNEITSFTKDKKVFQDRTLDHISEHELDQFRKRSFISFSSRASDEKIERLKEALRLYKDPVTKASVNAQKLKEVERKLEVYKYIQETLKSLKTQKETLIPMTHEKGSEYASLARSMETLDLQISYTTRALSDIQTILERALAEKENRVSTSPQVDQDEVEASEIKEVSEVSSDSSTEEAEEYKLSYLGSKENLHEKHILQKNVFHGIVERFEISQPLAVSVF